MGIRRAAVLSMALLIILTANQPSLTQGASGERENLVVPDDYYVAERCSELHNTLKLLRNNEERFGNSIWNIEPNIVAREMSSLCDRKAKGEISGDLWFEQFEALSVSLEGHLEPKDKAYLPLSAASSKTIPKNFNAYTMFLFPSVEWSESELKEDLHTINRTFTSFGDSIGDKRAAIWFTKGRPSEFLNIDIKRSKHYCDLLKLSYNDGPYIVTSLKRPDEINLKKDELVVIKLGGISPSRIVKVLNILEQDLRTDATIRKRPLIFEEIKQRLLSVADRNPDIVKELTKGAISVLTKQ